MKSGCHLVELEPDVLPMPSSVLELKLVGSVGMRSEASSVFMFLK